jgi:hypothetical protein
LDLALTRSSCHE